MEQPNDGKIIKQFQKAIAGPNPQNIAQTVEESIRDPEKLSLDERYDNEYLHQLQIENQGLSEFYSLRKGWSKFVGFILTLSILFQFAVTGAVGFHKMDFKSNEVLINLIMGENFIQILGLGYVIVNFLYPKKPEQSTTSPTQSDKK